MEFNPAVVLAEPAAFAAGLAVLQVPARRLERVERVALGVLAAASAVGAVASGGSPTGWALLNAALLAAVGAAAVPAGLAAPSWLILFAALACAVAGSGSVAVILALAAVGLVLVNLVIEMEPTLDAAAAALVVQAALRLTSPGGRGSTALVAAFVLIPLFAPGARSLGRGHRRLVVRAALGVVGFAVAGSILGALAAAAAVGPLRRGLSTATATLDRGAVADTEARATELAAAGRDFGRARRALDAWWARPAAVVPVVGHHWQVLRAAAITGQELAQAGQRALNEPALNDVRVTDGQIPLDQLASVQPTVNDLAARAAAARRRLDGVRSPWLVSPLSKKLDANLTRVAEVERTTQLARRALPFALRLLGQNEPRRYFLALQTPVEARASGGFMGNFGEIVATDGRLNLTRLGRQDELNFAPGRQTRTLTGPEEFLARYGRFRPEYSWANVNLSPNFPTTAQVIENLYPQSGGSPLDGVIAVDPAGLAALLQVVGPVQVSSWPTPITAENALRVLLYDQYVQFDNSQYKERIDFLGEVAQAVWSRLTSGNLPSVPELLSALGPAVRAKHLFLSSTRPDEQRLLEDMGVAGKVAPVAGDFAGLVTQNATGNKIEYFLRREMSYVVRLDPGSRRLKASVTITLHNDADPDIASEEAMVRNDLVPPLPTGTNKLYLSFYTPWELVGGRIDGAEAQFERATEVGRQVYSAALIIPPRSTATVELSLSGRLPKGDGYRLDLFRQPVVNPDQVTATLMLGPGWRAQSGRRTETTTLTLEHDTTIEVGLHHGWLWGAALSG